MRILLIEDDESIREVLKMILETNMELGETRVDPAANGTEAISCAKNACPDLVLLDLTLNGEDGFEVFNQLRETGGCANIPIIAVTAHSSAEMERETRNRGFAGFVTKPIDFETTLFPLIKRIMEREYGQAA